MFKELKAKLQALIESLSDELSNFAHALVQQIANNGGPVLMAAVKAEVAAAQEAGLAAMAAGNTMTGAQKFEAAQAGVIKTLTDAGVPLVMNAINGAIEMEVANLKTPAVAAAPAPAVVEVAVDPAPTTEPAPAV